MVSFTRLWATFKTRNHEFFRDRAAFGWNFLFPFLIVVGFSILFSGDDQGMFKVGFFSEKTGRSSHSASLPKEMAALKHIHFIEFDNFEQGLERLRQHKIDLLIQVDSAPYAYWMSDAVPNGYVAEKMLQASLLNDEIPDKLLKKPIEGRRIRYVDWLFPGILGMNMMFSALYGLGFVIVRYRKNGVLKRLKATPLTAFEYLAAQMLSRIFLIMFTLVILWVGCSWIFSFQMTGSYLSLLLTFFLGSTSLTALSLIFAARGTSEEFTNGALTFLSWPMMFLSEVWFSIEGAPQWVQLAAKIFPLTHLLKAVRSIMNDGANLLDVAPELGILVFMTMLFLCAGAAMFSWDK